MENQSRKAFHQMPPHLQQEYGYGYNNHIPWQKIHPSNTQPISMEDDAALAATPPTLSSRNNPFFSPPKTPTFASPLSSRNAASTPPRQTMPTPPFPTATRTLALPDTLLLPPQLSQQQPTVPQQPPSLLDEKPYERVLPPLTSLDLLHSSPFVVGAAAAAGLGGVDSLMDVRSSKVRPPPWGSSSSIGGAQSLANIIMQPPSSSADDEDDMPFAIEDSTNAFMSRSVLFQSTMTDVSQLADQLAEFKTFGASLVEE
jgi:hypothetical protein